ncbi:hypothetical protein PM10SUCC1_08500 [Propionigenium maris DSM 9537]|uniref:CRP/FNR family transcriptional regulator, anaerobic regulatory protein n=1 Tax=Propionigenium maris DSM 9537 TaxID=1123000 RepID=A0A9W6LLI3_9FUSO|nr:hypothetical protein [Propionigenium maris]GLI55336.1 hypothetical protein PM10SUCC1_08500 [Propionigenium maris DSM 9537]
MTKAEILYEVNLKELIGTPFEDMITVSQMKKGEFNFHENVRSFNACYLMEGHIQRIIYTPEGGEFYMDLFEGEISGANYSFSKRLGRSGEVFDMDVVAKEDSKIAYLPLEKIMDLQFNGKSRVLEKLIMMSVEEYFEKAKYLILKNVFSDEEFFINYLEKNKTINTGRTKELSELLNIKVRSIQRFIKKLQDQEIIEKVQGKIRIVDQVKLEEYKKRFDR